MKNPGSTRCAGCALLMLAIAVPLFAQGERGKAELKISDGLITVNYGRPVLKGRDMLSKLAVGSYWRLGKDNVTVLSAPIDLSFGSTKIPRGSHSLWLKRLAPDKYELVFNTQSSGHGMVHDASKDFASVPVEKSTLPKSVEKLTIRLQQAPQGGVLVIEWGTEKLKTSFDFGRAN